MPTLSFNLLVYVASYVLFFGLLIIAAKKGANRITNNDGNLASSPLLLLLHATGTFLFGILPFFPAHSAPFAISVQVNWLSTSSLVSLLLFVLMFYISPRLARQHYRNHKSKKGTLTVPSTVYLVHYFLLRSLFIVAYEIWFRGFLLSDTIAVLGSTQGIAINVFLYTMLHTVNGKKEMLGCIPFGLLLCLLSLWQGTVWPAVFIHLALTIPYEALLVIGKTTKTLPHEDLSLRRRWLHRA